MDLALARSVLYEALAIGLERPCEASRARLASDGAAFTLAAVAEVTASGAAGVEPVVLVRRAREVARAFARSAQDALATAHARLFGHTMRGAVVPYEAEYGDGDRIRAAQDLADISAFVSAFGLAISLDTRERPDHVAVECELVAFLARKEAHALEIGDDAMLDVTRRATRRFLEDHLLRFGVALAASIEREDAGGPYGALARLLDGVLHADAARWALRVGPTLLRLRDGIDDDSPMACEAAAPFVPLRARPGGARIL